MHTLYLWWWIHVWISSTTKWKLDWLTGFNGSAGIAIITLDTAAIFIDGRYTVQVTTQVDSNIFQIKHLINDPYLSGSNQQLVEIVWSVLI